MTTPEEQKSIDESQVLKELGFTQDSKKDVRGSISNVGGGGVFKLARGAVFSVVLIGIVVGSFFISYSLGKKILNPILATKVEPKVAELKKNTEREKELDRLVEQILDESKKAELGGVIVGGEEVPADEVKEAATPKVIKVEPEKVAQVEIKTLSTSKVVSPLNYYKVFAGVFDDKAKAYAHARMLQGKGFQTFTKKVASGEYVVQIGAFYKKSQAETLLAQAKDKGFEASVIRE